MEVTPLQKTDENILQLNISILSYATFKPKIRLTYQLISNQIVQKVYQTVYALLF